MKEKWDLHQKAESQPDAEGDGKIKVGGNLGEEKVVFLDPAAANYKFELGLDVKRFPLGVKLTFRKNNGDWVLVSHEPGSIRKGGGKDIGGQDYLPLAS